MLKYERIAQDITSAIANDEYNVGDKLPRRTIKSTI